MKNTKIPNFIFTIFIVLFPAIAIFISFSPEIYKKEIIEYKYLILISIGYLILIFLILFILIYLKVLPITFFNYNLPFMICLFIIIISYPLDGKWIILRIFLIILGTFIAVPTMLITNIIQNRKISNLPFKKNNSKNI
ncbi:MAG3450 family membrane protein [Mesomycoplasma lagogenitalium]|uniref:Uncharacterized protein n=1 Tax=Mesomycoplasma lagogenitalium TaxID=171286 RepID=A0ABY8LVU7_9BACT|nr:hypothetical protein [Mesomycoplasma lagogenitalium]WGI36356.1 hypothetical protein QEG99_02655 [Mesomycoplasma lagogenitalium]